MLFRSAYNAAKLALNSTLPLCFNKENLPEVILSACVVDSHAVVSSFFRMNDIEV